MYLNDATRSFIYKLLRKKRIKLNGKRAQGGELLQAGDTIEFHLSQDTLENSRKIRVVSKSGAPPPQGRAKTTHNNDLPPIVYEDENLLIINKPTGVASHGGMKSTTTHLLARVIAYLQQKGDYPPGATFTPALCNRLDVNTSGLVVCGKNYQALRAVNALFATPGAIQKQYLAIVEGELTGSATLLGLYHKDTSTNTVYITNCDAVPTVTITAANTVTTQYTSLAISDGRTLVSVNPVTGRSHQIRAHLAAIGHPLLGDTKYGSTRVSNTQGQLLHCNRLELTQPLLDYPINTAWVAEPPEGFFTI